MIRFFLGAVLVCLLTPVAAIGQHTPFRVMTYNSLRMSSNDQDRLDEFQLVLEASNPDILLMQEFENEGGAKILLAALNADSAEYSMAPYVEGDDTDNALFYRNSLVSFVSQDTIGTALREIAEYIVEVGGHEIRLYGAHLKAGSGASNQNTRFDEAVILREHLDNLESGTEFILMGDMNLTSSSEPAYQRLIQSRSDNDGRVRDLVDSTMIGTWRNNPAFAAIHTQSPRVTSFNGGAPGGMDDRFDFIFSSFGLNDEEGIEYVEGSYFVFGNDGLHYNTSILDGPNAAVSQEIAQALHDASDHLPVIADFISLGEIPPPPPVSSASLKFSEILYDTPGTDDDEEWIELYNPTDSTVSLAGWYFIDNNGKGVTYRFPIGATMTPKSHYTIGNDSDAFFSMYGYDADDYASLPFLNNAGDALLLYSPDSSLVDYVAWEGGASAGLPLFWGSDVHPLAIRGESIARADVSVDTDSFADWIVVADNGNPETQSFLVSGISPRSVSTEGAADLFDTALSQNYPNPVLGLTQIDYQLAKSEQVTIVLYDMLGREIELLVDTYLPAGAHSVSLDTSYLTAGVYMYRMKTQTFSATHQLVVAR